MLPMQCFHEPNHESGRAQRWASGMVDDHPFCVAGLWRTWEEAEGGYAFSFAQFTINADQHPLMKRFHMPGEEKRKLVIIPCAHYQQWLDAGTPEHAAAMLLNYPATQMKTWPAPKAPAGGQQSGLLF
ncbi:SOS response-associated peptidase family protein [Herbaspirillum huttiense]|uniref:SOS response-associated peptidase family protein n=1 Tax=Herbaspirillum huttiense TaxID=863372 RepID=UPI0039B04434